MLNFHFKIESGESSLLQQMDKVTSKSVKSAALLANAAPKKGTKTDTLPAGTSTRAASKLKPTDPSMAKFNLRNLNMSKNVDDLKYQIQVTLVKSFLHPEILLLAFISANDGIGHDNYE